MGGGLSLLGLLLTLMGCGSGPVCDDLSDTLSEEGGALTCEQAHDVVEWIELLAARPVPLADRRIVYREVASAWEDDAAATRAWLQQVTTAGATLERMRGLKGAEARAKHVYAARSGEGMVRPEHGRLHAVQERTLSVWAHADDDELAITEADLEAWIRYASLCREAQGATVLRISVADRVQVYTMLQERFRGGDHGDRVAMAAIGTYWPQVVDRWKAASYDTQQAWIQEAPLPPPMTATSLGYAEAIFTGPVEQHGRALVERLGPFQLAGVTPSFSQEAATP